MLSAPIVEVNGLSHLVEAATALTQLVDNNNAGEGCNSTSRRVSDDEEGGQEKPSSTTTTSGSSSSSSSTSSSITSSRNSSRNRVMFPQKLLEILADTSLSDVISWLPHGRSFVIIRPDYFTEHVLPKYLPPLDPRSVSTKYPSFTRKLNRWGFRQASRGPDTGAFFHPLFQRDDPELCKQMVCQKSRDRQQGRRHTSATQRRRVVTATRTTTTTTTLPPKKRTSLNDSKKSSSAAAAATTMTTLFQHHQEGNCSAAAAATTSTTGIGTKGNEGPAQNHGTTTSGTSSSAANAAVTLNTTYTVASSSPSVAGTKSLPSLVSTVDLDSKSSTSIVHTTKDSNGRVPFISNDTTFVANTLRQRDTLEVARAAKAMLYDAYLKAAGNQSS